MKPVLQLIPTKGGAVSWNGVSEVMRVSHEGLKKSAW